MIIVRLALFLFLPQILRHVKVSFVDEDAMAFFADVVKQTLSHRKDNKDRRNDFVDLVLDALQNEV